MTKINATGTSIGDVVRADLAAQEAVADTADIPGFDRKRFNENVVIFDEGDAADAAYLIVSGQVEIRKNVRSRNPQVLASLKRGDVFGELALFDGTPRIAQAVTRSSVEAIRISRDEFLNRLDTTDKVMKAIVLYVVKCMRASADEIAHSRDPYARS